MEDEAINIENPFLPENSEIDYLTVKDGTRLRIGYFPANGPAKASILLINGHREFLEKYSEFISDFQIRGINVYSMDHRGQGLSDRVLSDKKKSHNPDFDIIIEDIHELVSRIIKPDTLTHPLYMVAHSLGAHFAMRYLHDHPDVISKAVLFSPFTNLGSSSPFITFIAELYFMIMNMLGFSKMFAPGQARGRKMINHEAAYNALTHDKDRYEWAQRALNKYPELFIGGVTFGWVRGAIKSIHIIRQSGYVNKIKTPILCLLADDERVVRNSTTISLLNRMKNATYEIMTGARHEIYREVNEIRDKMWKKIDVFFDF